MKIFRALAFILSLFLLKPAAAQDTAFRWNVSSRKLDEHRYEISFRSAGNPAWQLYAPNQVISDVKLAEIQFDSAISFDNRFTDSGKLQTAQSPIFGMPVSYYEGPVNWKVVVNIPGKVPAVLQDTLLYSYGKGEEFYGGTALPFSVKLEGGTASGNRIIIPSINAKNPVAPCGDDDTSDKSLWTLFFIGAGAGLLALLFPCIFPLIPLTVSFFTKRSQSKKQGIINAFIYGGSIFLIYTLISLPFHLFNIRPEILNNISTNVPLNLSFFLVFVVFAISFFGYFEITLPSGFASKVDSKAGLGNILGIFFMALTLAIVSFSCTSGILGALLFGALSGPNGAWQLTAGMAGFGLGLGLPFVVFALFPNWLKSIPKSGGWMNELKAVFGFIELAMAVKFLSNADLVKQWNILPREVFFASWIVIGLAIVLYLLGVIRFPHDSKVKFSPARIGFIVFFAALTIYLVPGVTNTKAAKLELVSGFPPPFSYSIYDHPVNYLSGVQPIHNDYENALRLAKEQNKPLLIDFTGWACVNCRRMEENVWVDDEVKSLMTKDFVVVSLYVDERTKLPVSERTVITTAAGHEKSIETVGDQWATFQSENFFAVAQPQYAILSPDEKSLTKTKSYTASPKEFAAWLNCGLEAHRKGNK